MGGAWAVGNILGTLKMGGGGWVVADKFMAKSLFCSSITGDFLHCLTGRNILRLEAPLIRMIFSCETILQLGQVVNDLNVICQYERLFSTATPPHYCFPPADLLGGDTTTTTE